MKALLFVLFVTGLSTTEATRRKVLLRRIYRPYNSSYALESYSSTSGPNLCAVEYVPELHRTFHTDSDNWLRRDVCGYKTQVHHECCEGYTNLYQTSDCSAVIALRDVLQTANRMGAGLFVDYVQRTPSAKEALTRYANEGAVTLFAPSDEAIRSLSPENLQRFESNLHRNILYHVLQGRVHIKDLPDGDSNIQSLDGYYTPLKVSKFSNQVHTVNCHLITRRDHRATNGVVHVIDAVLDPPSAHDSTLLNVLSSDHQFTELYRLVSGVPKIYDLLRDSHRTLTFLAPTNQAFSDMDPAEYARIQRDYTLAEALLKLHIVEQSVCSPAVIESRNLRTLSDAKISISCDRNGVAVNGKESRFLKDYRFANNGFLTAVNKVLIPDSVRSVLTLLSRRDDLKLFVQFVRHYGLESYLRDSTVTVFAPDDNAIRKWGRQNGIYYDDHLYQIVTRDFIYNHIIYGKQIATSTFIDGKTISSMESYSNIRLKVARKWYGVDLAKLTAPDVKGSNGILHVIDRVLSQRRTHFVEWVNDNEIGGRFRRLVRRARGVMDELEHLGTTNASVTIFAPLDEAFDSFDIEKVLNTPKKIEHFVRGHIVHDEVPLETMSPNSTYLLSSESRSPLRIKSGRKTFTVNGVKIIKADELFADGVLHNIDKILVKAKYNSE